MLDVVAVSKKKGKIFIFNENFTEKKIFVEPVNNAWKPLKKHVMFFLKKIKKKKKVKRRCWMWPLYPNGY